VPRWHEPRQNVFPSFGKGKQEQREKQGIGLAGGTMSKEEILQKMEELYKSNGLNCCDEELIHEKCIRRKECWTEASIKERGNEKYNKMSLPYIGDKFKGDLLCIGLNLNNYGGKDAYYNLIDDEANGVKKLLTDGPRPIRINFNQEDYAGTFLFHRMSVYANIILDRYKYENDKILSLDDRILYDSRDYLAKIYSELIFLNAIKCSPKYENSTPFEPMYVNCFNNILCEEIKIIKPKNILVFVQGISDFIKIKFGCNNNIRKQKAENKSDLLP
jgi:hypothetical protein